MAKGGNKFTDRFPYSGLLLIIAITIAIPLTVWSLNNVSTDTKQQAQIPSCGPKNINPSCPNDYTCRLSSNNPLLGGTCILKYLRQPINLKSNASCKYNLNAPNDATILLDWDKTNNTTHYVISSSYYYLDRGKLINVKVNPYSTLNNKYTLRIPIPHGVKYFYWNVKAANSTYKLVGPLSKSNSVALNCN